MLVQETITPLPAAEVLRRAEAFFQARSRHATWVEQRDDGYVRFHADVGTVTVAALPQADGTTRVRASAARQWGMVGSFLTSLGRPGDVRGTQARRGRRRVTGAVVAPPALQAEAA